MTRNALWEGDAFDVTITFDGTESTSGRGVRDFRLERLDGTRGVWFDRLEVTDRRVVSSDQWSSKLKNVCGAPLGETVDVASLNEPQGRARLPDLGKGIVQDYCCEWTIQGHLVQAPGKVALAYAGLDGDTGDRVEGAMEAIDIGPTSPTEVKGRPVYAAYGCTSAGRGQVWLGFLLIGILCGWRRSGRWLPATLLLAIAVPARAEGPRASPRALEVRARRTVPRLVFTGLRADESTLLPEALAALSRSVEAEVTRSGGYRVSSQAQIEETLDLKGKQQLLGCLEGSGCEEAELPKVVDADRLLFGRVERAGHSLVLTLTLVDVRDGSQIATRQRRFRIGEGKSPVASGGFVRPKEAKDEALAVDATPIEEALDAIPGLVREVLAQDAAVDHGQATVVGPGGLVGSPVSNAPMSPTHSRGLEKALFMSVALSVDWFAQVTAHAPPVPSLSVGGYWKMLGASLEGVWVPTFSRGARSLDREHPQKDPAGAVGYTPVVLRPTLHVRSGSVGAWFEVVAGPVFAFPYLGGRVGLSFVGGGRSLRYEWRLVDLNVFSRTAVFITDAARRSVWNDRIGRFSILMALAVRYALGIGHPPAD